MLNRIEHIFENIMDHYMIVCLFLSLFILTFAGVGNILIVTLLGLILCTAGFVFRPIKVDLWIFTPLFLYNVASALSSYRTFGDITNGYASTQMIFPVFYLLMATLEKEELALLKQLSTFWAGTVAAIGILQFVFGALHGNGGRMDSFLGNPNATGVFLVIGWFSLLSCSSLEHSKTSSLSAVLPYLEPVFFLSVALTLSMGSFVAMAAGILVLLFYKKKNASLGETFLYGCNLLAKASLGVGTGLLLYLAADRTNVPWLCLLLFLYGLAVVLCWKKFEAFLKEYPRMAVIISFLGFAVAITAIAARPNAIATFTERLEMMRNGIGYLRANPLLGVGPYQWRHLNLHDSDKYFNTNHIHNVLIHVGVELGLIAAAMLVVIALRFYQKKKSAAENAEFTAFLTHNLMDTSFFYMGILSLLLLSTGDPKQKGTSIPGAVTKTMYGCFWAVFAFNLYCCLTMA